MASKESLGRVRHFDLVSQQLRLRHLRSISVRNLAPKFSISGEYLLDRLLETFFTLHNVHGHQNAIYTSEKIKYSLNPTWASFDPSSWTEQHSTAMTSFIMRIWGGQNDKFQLIIEWEVHLPSLQYLGDQVKSAKYSHNTVIFGLIDGYYGAPVVQNVNETTPYSSICASVLKTSSIPSVSQRKEVIKVDLDQVQPSYKVSSVQRLQMIQKSIQQTQLSVKDVCQSIQTKVESDLKCTSQLSEEEMLKLKIKLLREEFLSKQKLLLQEREEEQDSMEKLQKRELDLRRNKEQLTTDKNSLRKLKKAHIEKRELLVKLNAQLHMRRRQLVSELMSIYPIVELQGSKEHLICGVRLHNCESDEFAAMDDETLSVALGYTCHLVSMIARFLELPLRYPVNSRGSRSTVNDFTIEKVAEKDRKFPLYSKGKEGTKFFYGTFLLNKNIAQIRQYNGLGTPNLRNTLPNLRDLLESKFRTSDLVKSAPLTIIRKSPLKHQKNRSSNSGSGGSRDSSPHANSKLDDVLIKTMNASAAEVKPAIPDQRAKPDLPDEPEKPFSLDQSVLPEPPAKPALPPKPVLHALSPKPALPPKPLLHQLEKPAPSANPALPDYAGKPGLPAKPEMLDQNAKPVLPAQLANSALPDSQRKPVLPAPLSAAQLHQMQTAENSPKAAKNFKSSQAMFSLPEENVVDDKQQSAATDAALHIPSQGTSRGFLEQKRMKKVNKSKENSSTTGKAHRTFSFKSRKSNTVDKQVAQCESVGGANVNKGVLSNCAENTGEKLNEFDVSSNSGGLEEVKREETGRLGKVDTFNANGKSAAERQRSERYDLFARPDVTGKQFHGDGIRSKSIFDVDGSINFDVRENGEIDLT